MPVLTITDLKKSFIAPDGTRTQVVDVPRFELQDGEHQALRGSSGSGKTTFLNLIAGILQADSGSVVIDSNRRTTKEGQTAGGIGEIRKAPLGKDIAKLPESERDRLRAMTIGYVFQTFNLLQGYTALENVMLGMMFGPGVNPGRARELLERVGLKERMNYRPRQLSIGQQQRVAIARALANQPKLVLADEPTGNLDARNATEALDLIRGTCKEAGAALLLVSHDEAVLKNFDQVIELAEINRAAVQNA